MQITLYYIVHTLYREYAVIQFYSYSQLRVANSYSLQSMIILSRVCSQFAVFLVNCSSIVLLLVMHAYIFFYFFLLFYVL